jgi:hypothetical protein
MFSHKNSVRFLGLITALAMALMFFVEPIPQDPAYHLFADAREIARVPNFWNVISNLPFLFVGIYGLARYSRTVDIGNRAAYLLLCSGVFLVGFGSAYYHWSPSTASLLWDRLPMTVAFMALFALLLEERIPHKNKLLSLWLLVAIGVGSAVYWSYTESLGHGDLRPYALVQFLPLILIPLMLLLFKANYLRGRLIMAALGWYVIAKIFEFYDPEVFDALGLLSGHTIKHLIAGVAVLYIILAVPEQKARR